MELADKLLLVLRSYTLPVWATIISGLFVVVSLSLSLYLLLNHLSAYKNPEVGWLLSSINVEFMIFYTAG